MLAGRKLLLADDSVTIQKVIDLTFADEGVRVVAFGNGEAALEKIEEIAPDVVLADVFMPGMNGYAVCEYIKQNEKLKHIPVMLLVGSFEPFDEVEARRVGADDILTKPFQSIRRLIDRVGALMTSKRPDLEEKTATAELPKAAASEEVKLTPGELELTTADTLPLRSNAQAEPVERAWESESKPWAVKSKANEEQMESPATEVNQEMMVEGTDTLLDLGDLEPLESPVSDDFVLDLDLDEPSSYPSRSPYSPAVRNFAEPQVMESVSEADTVHSYRPQVEQQFAYSPSIDSSPALSEERDVVYEGQVHEVSEPVVESMYQSHDVEYGATTTAEPAYEQDAGPQVVSDDTPSYEPVRQIRRSEPVTPQAFTPELIDAIARRVVERMSDQVVREIAWEVVPDLAELMIKRQLEEKESQPK